MAHPFASQAKSSQKARLKRLGATAGKSYGSSSMYKAKSLPKKNAGSSTPMTISGGSAKKRPDRMAAGGSVGGHKRRPHATTNIIISHAGGRGGSGGGGGAGPNPPQPVPVPRPVPVPVNRPVPVPVAGGPPGMPPGGPPGMPPGAGLAARPPIASPAGPPPGAGLPMRPPGMKTGGAVKKAAKGGFLRDANSPKAGDAYPGFPHSPTTKAKSTVSAKADGGPVKKAGGGGITITKKLQLGGGADSGLGMGVGGGPGAGGGPGQAGPAGAANAALGAGPGRVPLPPQQGAPNISGRQAIPFAQPNVVPLSGFGARNFSTRPAPGTTTTYAKKGGAIYKKGGAVHDDEAQDKKLFKKMLAKEDAKEGGAEKKASGGGVGPGLAGPIYRTQGPKGGKGKGLSPYSDAHDYHNQGKGYAAGGSVQGGNVHGAGSAAGRMARNNKVPAKTEL